jgi:GAF domain-containing protein
MSDIIMEPGDEAPADRDPAARMKLLKALGLYDDIPIPELDALATSLARDVSDQTGIPDGFAAFVNVMKEGYQYFAGIYLPRDKGAAVGVPAAAPEVPAESRFMPRSEGWCVYTVERKRPLPLRNIFDKPRWSANGAVYKLGAETYLGAPLINSRSGIVFGTVAVVGQKEFRWENTHVDLLKKYASLALEAIAKIPGNTETRNAGREAGSGRGKAASAPRPSPGLGGTPVSPPPV